LGCPVSPTNAGRRSLVAAHPLGKFLLSDSRSEQPEAREHEISLARRDQPDRFYRIYRYPRLADLYFSPDEQYLVIADRSGSGWTECALLRRIDKPPFFVPAKPAKVDDQCWALFWAQHHKPERNIQFTHRSTYLCEWLDGARFVVGLNGDNQGDGRRWGLEGGWHCIYDVKRGRACTNEFTDSVNKSYAFTIR
jgi:hypothetical protein